MRFRRLARKTDQMENKNLMPVIIVLAVIAVAAFGWFGYTRYQAASNPSAGAAAAVGELQKQPKKGEAVSAGDDMLQVGKDKAPAGQLIKKGGK